MGFRGFFRMAKNRTKCLKWEENYLEKIEGSILGGPELKKRSQKRIIPIKLFSRLMYGGSGVTRIFMWFLLFFLEVLNFCQMVLIFGVLGCYFFSFGS